ncbi:MAG: glycosyltransferase family 87 protein [Bacteroidia bacterium]
MLGDDHFWGTVAYKFYNNFVIFGHSFLHLLHNENLYTVYPAEYADLYKYSPAFAFLMGPFSVLPDWLGLFLWNLLGVSVLLFALQRIVKEKRALLWAFVFILPELILTTQNSQSNALIAGCLIFAFDALERSKTSLAALLIAFTVFIKLFTVVAFVLFLFYPNKVKSALSALLWTVIFLCVPALVTGPSNLLQQYMNWAEMLRHDHSISYGIGLLGLLHTSPLPVNKSVFLLSGIVFLLLPLINYKSWSLGSYKLNYLCLILVWMVIFNHKAESPSYILAFAGCALWAYTNGLTKPRLIVLILCFVFSSLACTDLCPHYIRVEFVIAYSIKALFPSVVFFMILKDLLADRHAAAALN